MLAPRAETLESRFALGPIVGRGAFGEVFRAVDTTSSRTVAIKRLRADLGGTDAALRFEREARLLATLASPHVVAYVWSGVDATGRACLAMEWLEGDDLSVALRRRALDSPTRLEIVRQCARGLADLHAVGIVHRDVKPANVFLVPERDGSVHAKLIDLGVARAADEAALTAAGHKLGTPAYMSPEQARGEDGLRAASDLFSLGVVAFELFAGRRPFEGGDPFAVLAKIVLEEPPSLASLTPSVPNELSRLVESLLEKTPAARPPSAAWVAEQLESIRIADVARSTSPLETHAPADTGELRIVTGLFARFDPADPNAAPRNAFEAIAQSHGATVHRLLSNGMVAVFGGEHAVGDEPIRAAHAALALRGQVPALRLATGRAVGSPTRISGTMVERGTGADGEAPEGIGIDAATASLLAGRFELAGSGERWELRGEAVGEALSTSRRLGRESPWVGRDRELGALLATADEVARDRVVRMALVVAPAGGGKTRLRSELSGRLRDGAAPFSVLIGRGDPLTAGSPLAMAADVIRNAIGARSGDDGESRGAALARVLQADLASTERPYVQTFLGELIGAAPDGRDDGALQAARRDPNLMADAVRSACEAWIAARCARGPVFLALEDVHWGDAGSLALVHAVARHLADRAPLFVLATARPEVRHSFPNLWSDLPLDLLTLAPLSRSACERLAQASLGGDIDGRRVGRIVDRAAGNPFFIEQLAKAARESNGTNDAEIPDTVLGTLQARMDALSPGARRVLRAASVLGGSFADAAALASIEDGGRGSDARGWFDELVRREMLVPRGTAAGGVGRFEFRHALLRDAAYETMPDADRSRAHARAGAWLAEHGHDDAHVLARHFDLGGDRPAAIAAYARAAEQALAANDMSAALSRVGRGIELGASGETLGRLHAVAADSHRWRGERDPALAHARSAVSLLPSGSSRWFHALGELAAATGESGDYGAVPALIETAREAAFEAAARSARLVCLCRGAMQLVRATQYVEADALIADIERELAAVGTVEPWVEMRVQGTLALRARHAGDIGRVLRAWTVAYEAAQRAHDERSACLQGVSLGCGYAEIGRFGEAEALFRRALATAERLELARAVAFASANLGEVLTDTGRADEGDAMLSRACDLARANGIPRLAADALLARSKAALARGDRGASLAFAAEARDEPGVPLGTAAVAHAMSARAHLALGETGAALEQASRAMEVLERVGAVGEREPMIPLAYARALRAHGRDEEARDVLLRALQRLSACADAIADPRLREEFLHNVPVHVELRDEAR